MNNQRIIDWIDGLFASHKQTDAVKEQKEELQIHIIDRIKEYMSDSMDFDQAFEAAKEDLSDLNELLASFERKRSGGIAGEFASEIANEISSEIEEIMEGVCEDIDEIIEDVTDVKKSFSFNGGPLVAISPFIYLFLGFTFGWWAWGWMIIPISAILFNDGFNYFGHRLIAISPFVYLFMGSFFGWWAWGWIIIPVTAILYSTPIIKINPKRG